MIGKSVMRLGATLSNISLRKEIFVLILDTEGYIWYDSLKTIQFGCMKKIRNCHDETTLSLFYSKSQRSIYLGHSNNQCFKIGVKDFDLHLVNMENRTNVKVLFILSPTAIIKISG